MDVSRVQAISASFMGDARIQAAIIAASAATLVAVVNILYNIWSERRRHEDSLTIERRRHEENLMIASLGRFEGGSQKRSVGIAALQVMRSNPEVWSKYRETIKELYVAQVLYLFVHGNNRWESHEIANIDSMMEWLMSPEYLQPTSWSDRQLSKRLKEAMDKYDTDYSELSSKKPWPKDFQPDNNSVEYIRNKIKEWKRKLP